MNDFQLKQHLGMVIIISHLLIVLLIFIFYEKLEWGNPDDYPVNLFTVLPITGLYVTTVIKSFIQTRHSSFDYLPKSNTGYLFICFIFGYGLPLFIIFEVVFQAIKPGESTPYLNTLGYGETVFGAGLGLIIGSLFPNTEKGSNPDEEKENKDK